MKDHHNAAFQAWKTEFLAEMRIKMNDPNGEFTEVLSDYVNLVTKIADIIAAQPIDFNPENDDGEHWDY